MALKGINLGGWLIAERWMTPGLFEGVKGEGERAIGRELPHEEATRRIDVHRSSFITEQDFQWIAAQGFDFVRLPVGYWLFEEAESFISGEKYVQLAFQWAREHKLKVILDFHGLQGSQNGQDHSGQAGKVRFYRSRHRSRALATVEYLTRHYGREPGLLAIELINEPKAPGFLFRLVNYYIKAYKIAVANVDPGVKIIVSDAFRPMKMARALGRRRLGDQLVLDVHLYQLFSQEDQQMSLNEHMVKAKDEWTELLTCLSEYMPVLVGEWSAVLPEKVSSAGSCEDYYRAQKRTFDACAWAHSYWSYKVPGSAIWSFRDIPFEK